MNDERNMNWDEIMFSLLEGEIIGSERASLMQKIESDLELSSQWKSWTETVYTPLEKVDQHFIDSLKKEEESRVILWLNWRIAAGLLILIGLGFWMYMSNSRTGVSDKLTSVKDAPSKSEAPLVSIDSNKIAQQPDSMSASSKSSLVKQAQKTNLVTYKDSSITMNQDEQIVMKSIENDDTTLVLSGVDSALVKDLKEVLASGKVRTRGEDIIVTIESKDGPIASNNSENKLNSILANYEFGGLKRKYTLLKEECEGETLCYTLIIEEGNRKSIIKL